MRRLLIGNIVGFLLPLALSASAAIACVQPEGNFSGSPQLNYSCPAWGIDWTVETWTFTDLGGGQIMVSADPGGFPELTGTLNCADSSFSARSVSGDGFCTADYQLSGRFTSATHWTGTFSALYIGYCQTCPGTDEQVEGILETVSVAVAASPQMSLSVHPNPLREGAQISLSLTRRQDVLVEVLDLVGRRISILHNAELTEGNHLLRWNRMSTSGAQVPAGLYLVRARVGREQLMAKAVVVN